MPHTWFRGPTTGAVIVPRESTELRALAFFAD